MALGSAPVLVIRRSQAWLRLDFGDLWRHRELLYFIIWRDVKVRYQQTVLGASWAVLQPFLLMTVFSIFLGMLARVPSDGLPYPIFAYAGLVPWTLFAQTISGAADSLVSSSNLITKAYFPRLILPVASAGSYFLDFTIALTLLFGMMFFYGVNPTFAILWLPVLTFLTLLTALAIGIWLAALNVKYRDVRYAVPFVVQLWLFATPVAYPTTIVPKGWRLLIGLNPMAGVVEGFRWALLGTGTRPGLMVVISATVTSFALLSGLIYFQRMERSFADVI